MKSRFLNPLLSSLCFSGGLLLLGCDGGESSVSSTVTEGGTEGGSEGGSEGGTEGDSSGGSESCELSEASVDLEIEVDGFEFPFDNADVPCTVVETGFDCDLDGTSTALPVTAGGAGPLPWDDGDSVLVTVSNGSTTIMHIVEVKNPDGLLLGLLIDGDPGFQSSVDIELEDAMCTEGEGSLLPLRAVYTLGGSTLELLGAAEGELDTPDGLYRVRQEASGTSLGNPDQPDFVTATVLLEG